MLGAIWDTTVDLLTHPIFKALENICSHLAQQATRRRRNSLQNRPRITLYNKQVTESEFLMRTLSLEKAQIDSQLEIRQNKFTNRFTKQNQVPPHAGTWSRLAWTNK